MSGRLSRRTFLAATGAAAVAACSRSPAMPPQTVTPANLRDAIARTEAARPHSGRTVTAQLTPQPVTVDLGGPKAATLAYGPAVPGPLIRAQVGDELAVTVTNPLDHPTSVHWHGIALRNDMDGAEPATADIAAGATFTYRFSLPHSGTYWAHPHTGLDADYGLYLPVIIDDPREPGRYDAEWIVVLDDWTAGIGPNPPQIYDALRHRTHSKPGMDDTSPAGPVPGVDGAGTSELLGGDAGDVSYPYYLVNGRIPTAPTTFTAAPGQRIRLRLINAGADTAFRVALGGHTMTVTHTDGHPVTPHEVDALLIGMGERYDVVVAAGDGLFPLVAAAEGKNAYARALLSTGEGSAPDADYRPPELTQRVGTADMFTATGEVDLDDAAPDVTLPVTLTGSMTSYDWSINGKPYPGGAPLIIRQGQRGELTFTNSTMMWHPMHLHGHRFQILRADGTRGPCKDTAIVLPRQTLRVALVADNPGVWMLHCHDTYHQEAGMMTQLSYSS